MRGLDDVIETTKIKLNKYADCDISPKHIRQLAEMLATEAVDETIFSMETLYASLKIKKMMCNRITHHLAEHNV